MTERRNPAHAEQFDIASRLYQAIPVFDADLAVTVDPGVTRRAFIEADQLLRAVLARHRRHRR